MSLAISDDSLPRRFGRYVLFSKIGEGGMARLYLAKRGTELGAQRRVVVKQILPLLSSSPEFSTMLIDEAKLSAQLTHGNVVQIFDLGREEGTLYIAMEYVDGFDLRELLRQCTKQRIALPSEFSLHIVHQVLVALDYAHRKRDEEGHSLGIVHRDVSPSNVLLSFEGEVKLCDFGIARAVGIQDVLPDEVVQGKVGYMSPETAAGDSVDARSDLFSVGIILWELIAGRRLYRGRDGKPATLQVALEANIPELSERGWPNEAELHRIVFKALKRDPDGRYQSAKDMLADLDEYLHSAGMFVSQLKFGRWLADNFGAAIIERRRVEEQEAEQLRSLDAFDGDEFDVEAQSGARASDAGKSDPNSWEQEKSEQSSSRPRPRVELSSARDAASGQAAPGAASQARSERKSFAWLWVVLLVLVFVAIMLARQLS